MTEPKRMKSDQVRKNWRDVLDHVKTGGTVIVEHYNRPIADVVPHGELKKLRTELEVALHDLEIADDRADRADRAEGELARLKRNRA